MNRWAHIHSILFAGEKGSAGGRRVYCNFLLKRSMGIIIVCLLLTLPWAQATEVQLDDQMTRTALTEFKRQIVGFLLQGEQRLLGSWQVSNSSASYCDWKGVLCDDKGRGRVAGISLPGLGLQGTIAPALFNLTSLLSLDLSYNAISGGIPPLPLGLRSLNLASNNLTGPLPPQLGQLSSLRWLYLQGNRLEGPLPPHLGNLSSLQKLFLEGNRLEGPLAPQLGKLSSLGSLDLQGNRLEGPLPPHLGNLSSLQELFLKGNRLEGLLPPQLGNLFSLRSLNLQGNRLEGPLPPQLGNLSSLQFLSLQGNALQGSIPEGLFTGRLGVLISLTLSHNTLTGAIPNEIGALQSALVIDFSHNTLTGAIPNEIGALQSAQVIDFSHNELHGTIPTTIVQCHTLQLLNLSHNKLQGQIPAGLGQLDSLASLDLSANNLTGQIPIELSEALNLTAGSFADNPGLCGPPLTSACPALAEPNLKTNSNEPNLTNKSRLIIVVIVCGTNASLIIFCCILFAWCKNFDPLSQVNRQVHQDLFKTFSALQVTAEELEIATGGFNEGNLIGTGGTSKVYKATLKEGQVVAVKKFNLEGNLENSEYFFHKECETLGKMRHRNLVRILSTCCNLEMKAIVLEYMPNGSLEKLLFESEGYQLNWRRLVDIALDVAQALVYLHHEFGVPVIHCDLKPSNILLDKFYTAHISDFGIARLLSSGNDCYSASYFKGSIGYIAPECAQIPHHSVKGDIYSYGVIVLCMLTGRQPTSELFYELGVDMPSWVKCFWPDKYMDALHPTLRLEMEAVSMQEKEALRHVMEVALWCTVQARKDRPTSMEVLRQLSPFKSPRHL